jgi:hypothetical protein
MITTLVTFKPRQARSEMTAAEKLALYEATAPKYREIPGLIRKHFMGNGERAGGWYEWETKAHADAYYTAEWKAFITETYGTDLTLEFFDCPAVVDNDSGKIVIAPEVRAAAQAEAAE